MKNTLITLALLFSILFISTGFKKKDFDHFVPFKKSKVVGTDKYFVSKYELTNGEYKIFLNEVEKKEGKDAINNLLPNGENWEKVIKEVYSSSGKPFQEYYFSHPAYNNYPVVNLNKKAVQQYCDWMTEK